MRDQPDIADQPLGLARVWPRSLQGQLVLIPAIVLFIGLLVVVGIILVGAQARIAAEILSGTELGDDLVTTALRNVANDSSAAVAFERLSQSLPHVRHVQFTLVSPDGTVRHGGDLQDRAARPEHEQWLARFLAPPPVERVFPVAVRGQVWGEIRVHSHAADEIREIVSEVMLASGVLIVLCVLIVTALRWAVRRSLRWIHVLADGFDRLDAGDYVSIAPIPLIELRRIGEQFNRIVQSLQRVSADNHLLVDRLLSMQERERKELAGELHDEFGPALFGIRAEAACIKRMVPLDDPRDHEIRARAQSIAELTDGIQKLNYRMLDRLRPLVLEQMGLGRAVRQLVASWQARYPEIIWVLMIGPDFDDPDEATSLTLYRAAQECVTNVIRHADASEVSVCLCVAADDDNDLASAPAGGSRVVLRVQDNGKGLSSNVRYGFGLLGMAERVRQQRGTLRVGQASPHGVVVELMIPRQGRMLTMDQAHANSAD